MYGWDEDSFFAFFNNTWDLRGIADDGRRRRRSDEEVSDIFDFQNAPPRRAVPTPRSSQRGSGHVQLYVPRTSNLVPTSLLTSLFDNSTIGSSSSTSTCSLQCFLPSPLVTSTEQRRVRPVLQATMSMNHAKKGRIHTRVEQRNVNDKIVSDRDAVNDSRSIIWDEYRSANNAICERVIHVREGNLDAQNVVLLAKALHTQAASQHDISRMYDFTSYASALTDMFCNNTDHTFSWTDFGRNISVLSRRKEQLCTMFGPIGMYGEYVGWMLP